jgi:YD repeat-containing protein
VYGYDHASNLTSITPNAATQSFTYSNTNAISSGSYDANGSPAALGQNSYKWDGENRIVHFASTPNNTTSSFTYDGLGRLVRVIDTHGAAVTADHSYFWCGATLCLAHDNTQSGSPVSTQYFDQGVIANGTSYYYVRDQLGSVSELISSTGTVASEYTYDPYGNRTTVSGTVELTVWPRILAQSSMHKPTHWKRKSAIPPIWTIRAGFVDGWPKSGDSQDRRTPPLRIGTANTNETWLAIPCLVFGKLLRMIKMLSVSIVERRGWPIRLQSASGPSTKNSPNEKGTAQPIAARTPNATKRNSMSPDMTPTGVRYSLNRTRRGVCRSLPPVSIRHRSSGRPAAGHDDGFAERSPIFLLADRIHRPQLRQQLVDQRTQPRPRRAVRE